LPSELIVSDDHSTDATIDIVREFARSAPFPVCIKLKDRRLGFNDNFFHAIGLCRGSLIAPCDQDDVWTPTKLALCEREFHDPEVRLVIHSVTCVDETLRPTGNDYPSFVSSTRARRLEADPWLQVHGMSMIFRGSLVNVADHRTRPPSRDLDDLDRHAMDYDEWLYFLALITGSVVLLSDRLALYRQHAAQFVGAADRRLTTRLSKLLTGNFADHKMKAEFARRQSLFWAGLEAQQLDAHLAECFRDAARSWQRYAELSQLRDGLYCSDRRRIANLERLVELLWNRAYRARGAGGLGGNALLRDLRQIVWPT
jgi:glycosyltransferase involved in cell wall biosynthesis